MCVTHTLEEAQAARVERMLPVAPAEPVVPRRRRCAHLACAKEVKLGSSYCKLHQFMCSTAGCMGRTNGIYCTICRDRQLVRAKQHGTRP